MFSKSGLPDAFSVLARWLRVFYVLCRHVFSTVFFFFSSSHLCNLLFNCSLKTQACLRPYASYRASFELPTGQWETVRIPWSDFRGKGPGAIENPFDVSMLTRAGVVSIGKEMKHVVVALSSFRFYSNKQESQAPLLK
jgi:hypothetical protein